MLRHLTVSNYALIDEVAIDFCDGFTSITGETGAGKSLLLGALGFVLGDRADTSVLFNKEKKCVVEAVFSLKDDNLKSFFEENDLDYDNISCVLRRELTPQKKSRAFINDTPVNLNQLKELGSHIVDIHSQHDSLLLADDNFQLILLDNASENASILQAYKIEYQRFMQLKRDLQTLRDQAAKSTAEHDFVVFQYEELKKADLQENEYEELVQRLELLRHSEEVKELLVTSLNSLEYNDFSIVNELKELKSSFERLSRFVATAQSFVERVEAARIDLKDIARDLESLNEASSFDPSELVDLEERFDLIQNLMMKHHVQEYSELLLVRDEYAQKVSLHENLDGHIEAKEREIEASRRLLSTMADKLHERRAATAKTFASAVTSIIRELSMPFSIFEVEIEKMEDLGATGHDKVRFMFSANKGVKPDLMSKVASGGELSRLMLAVKSVAARSQYIPTLIFDEIDTGVSGEVASKLGSIMLAMGATLQIVSITHLPQIASKAQHQLFVYKDEAGTQTHTMIRELSMEERVTEIAKMLSNDVVTEAAKKAAATLLER